MDTDTPVLDPERTDTSLLTPIAEEFTEELLRQRIETETNAAREAVDETIREAHEHFDKTYRRKLARELGQALPEQEAPETVHKLHTHISLMQGAFDLRHLTHPLPETS